MFVSYYVLLVSGILCPSQNRKPPENAIVLKYGLQEGSDNVAKIEQNVIYLDLNATHMSFKKGNVVKQDP